MMRITYKTLAALIDRMTEEQKNSDVTVEIPDTHEAYCYPAHLRIAGEEHDGGLDVDHPVIFVDALLTDEQAGLVIRRENVDCICQLIGLNQGQP